METGEHLNWIGRLVGFFVNSKITPLILGFALFLGIIAVVNLPREEEPQISVPMFDIFVRFPGSTSQEVEERIVNVGERKLWEIPGVEYIYSTSQPDGALLVVRFKVGEDVEKSLTKLYTKVFANLDFLPPGASKPLIKYHSIDDVPILALTFYSDKGNSENLRRIVAGVQQEVNAIPDISQTQIIGGHKRTFRVVLDPQKLTEHLLDPMTIEQDIGSSNIKVPAGHLQTEPDVIGVESDAFISSKKDLESLVVGSSEGHIVYLKDVARVVDGPDIQEHRVNIRFGNQKDYASQGPFKAVTLAISKRKGSNAAWLSTEVLKKVDTLKGSLIPDDVRMKVTRDYGQTATEKSNELLLHMGLAVAGVALIIALVLGWKEAGIVAVTIPLTLSLTLAAFYWIGFTLNRITLFALIFSIGILVDGPIVNVENIVRHLRLAQNQGRKFLDIVIGAVNEVQSPLILAALTVISAILPMAFVGGLMGPYMRPIPIGSSLAILFSTLMAFVATPWAATLILRRSFEKGGAQGHDTQEDFLTRVYRSYMKPLIYKPQVRNIFLIAISVLLLLAISLIPLKLVKVKMLPFDNKNEFQVVLDMPQGTSLAATGEVIGTIAKYLQTVPEVDNIEAYAGTSAPYNFNGLVRHYYLRQGTNQADLQVNLLPKSERRRQSHDIAKAVRPMIHEIVSRWGGHVQVAEVPPGPPVLSTLVMEIYGPNKSGIDKLTKQVEQVMGSNSSVTDLTAPSPSGDEKLFHLVIDRRKAGLNGIAPNVIADTIATALAGKEVGLAHLSNEYEPVAIVVRLPESKRHDLNSALDLTLLSNSGVPVPLKDLVKMEDTVKDKPIFHKNLMRVGYVFGDVAGPFESPVYVLFDLQKAFEKLPLPSHPDGQQSLKFYWTGMPPDQNHWALKFDGEWQITYEVFRDLGIAFAVVLVLIYVLVVGWFRSFKVPLIIMMPIPLSLIGILPAHWMTGMFFTATSMIGMIAGAGIVVQNSIIMVDFIHLRLKEGMPLEEAVVDAGAVRFRPMLLTAMAVVVGASVILFDPIFQGLALSLLAGEFASTFISRTAIPVIYYIVMKPKARKEK
ncbi:MAG: efflux RND transporter permease subunit [Candidatus Omnitrophica bacterium]|nr:efflux RND transporter permease subunit [Candidatus Omnitrophota bacterium]MDE2221456.1 efflux RND transporter permease subunit [Candidatus Omnitrophota bacterium]